MPATFKSNMEEFLQDSEVFNMSTPGSQAAGQNLGQPIPKNGDFYTRLKALFSSLPTNEARTEAASVYFDRIKQAGWVETNVSLSKITGAEYVQAADLDKQKEDEQNALAKETQVYINRDARDTAAQIKTLVDTKLKDYVSIQEGEDGTLKIIEKFRVATPTVQDISKIPELRPIKPPQEQDILVRTAEYYEPFGTEDFKQQVAQLEDERKQRKQFKEQAEEEARQQLEASLPEWGGRALRVGGAVKESLGKSDDALKELGQPEKLAFGLVDTDLTMSEKIAKIDEVKEWSDTERDRALTVLMRDMMKKRNKRIEDSAAEILKPEK
jgi:hypothetical protein